MTEATKSKSNHENPTLENKMAPQAHYTKRNKRLQLKPLSHHTMHASVFAKLLYNGRSLQGELPRRHEDKHLSHTNDEIPVNKGSSYCEHGVNRLFVDRK